MPALTPFKLLVLGAIDLLSLGSTRQHKEHQMELIRITRSREEYFKEGAFRVSDELRSFLSATDFGTYDGIIICHHGGWGHDVMKFLPSDLEAKILVVDRTRAPKGYDPAVASDIYSDCWGWIRSRVTVRQATALIKENPTSSDAPYCYQCAIQMQRAGSCFACPSCGSTSGCS